MASSGVRDVVIVLAARVGAVLLGIPLQSCLAWLLGPEGRGAYAVAVVYSSLLSVGFGFGLDGAAQYSLASGRVAVDRGVSALLALQFAAAVVGVVAGLAALQLPLAFFDKAEPRAFLLAVVIFPIEMVSAALILLLGSRREFAAQAVLLVTQMGLRFGFVVLLVWGFGLGVEGALLANLGAFVACACTNLVFLHRRHGFRWVWPTRALSGELLRYGSRYYLAAFSALVNTQVGVIMVAFLASKEEVGLYSAAVGLVVYVLLFSEAVGATIHPRIAADRAGRPELAAQGARFVGIVSALVLIGIAVAARPIVQILLSPSFLPIVPVVRILALGIALRSATKVLVHYFNATGRPGIFSAATVLGMATNALLLLVLLPKFGLPGAAWAMTLAYLLNSTVLVVAFRIQSGLGLWESWMPNRSDLEMAQERYREVRRRVAGG